jgi:cysteinyl-tRNA synthetase
MVLRYLGEQIDIHGGGEDLIFPHHENEIAQTEAYTGKPPFVRYWVHNAWVKAGEEKMSKSLGNFVTIADALEHWPPDAIRLWVLTSHYRTPLTYTQEALLAAKRGAERLRQAARAPSEGTGEPLDPAPCCERFIEAMDEDLNSSKGLAALFDLATGINRARDEGRPVADAQAALLELAGVLGLTLTQPEAALGAAPFIELMITLRAELRAAKQFALADRVRDGLAELGVALEDTPRGTEWRQRE